jgi:hypothetical protein
MKFGLGRSVLLHVRVKNFVCQYWSDPGPGRPQSRVRAQAVRVLPSRPRIGSGVMRAALAPHPPANIGGPLPLQVTNDRDLERGNPCSVGESRNGKGSSPLCFTGSIGEMERKGPTPVVWRGKVRPPQARTHSQFMWVWLGLRKPPPAFGHLPLQLQGEERAGEGYEVLGKASSVLHSSRNFPHRTLPLFLQGEMPAGQRGFSEAAGLARWVENEAIRVQRDFAVALDPGQGQPYAHRNQQSGPAGRLSVPVLAVDVRACAWAFKPF